MNHKKPKTDFSDFYAEQNKVGSNVYFAVSQRAVSKNEEHIDAPKKRLHFSGGMLSVFFGVALVSLFVIMRSEIKLPSNAVFASSKIYEHIFSGHKALARFDIQKTLFDSYTAYKQLLISRDDMLVSPLASLFYFEDTTLDIDALLIQTGIVLAKSVEPLSKLSQATVFKNIDLSDQSFSLGDVLTTSAYNMESSKIALVNMQEKLKAILDTDIAASLRNQINAFILQLSVSHIELSNIIDKLHFASWVLGVDKPKRFLVVVQDTRSPWATGGRASMYGVIHTKDGMIEQIIFDDVGNLDGALDVKIIPPTPVQDMTTSWNMSFANWFFDVPLSLDKFEYFYKKAGGFALDGVIVINDTILADILNITGPRIVEGGGLVSAENIADIIADSVMREAVPLLIKAVSELPQEKLLAVFSVIQDALLQKDMLVRISSKEYQKFVTYKQWDRKISQINVTDYTAVVLFDMHSEFARQAPWQNIFKHIDIKESGEVTGTLVTEIQQASDISRLLYVKTYLPKGTKLVEAVGQIHRNIVPPIDYMVSGFTVDIDVALSEASKYIHAQSGTEIFEESGYTVFGNWVLVPPKQSTRLIYNYTLPFSVDITNAQSKLNVVFQKQPGSKTKLNFTVTLPDDKQFISTALNGFTGEFLGEIKMDKIFNVVFE